MSGEGTGFQMERSGRGGSQEAKELVSVTAGNRALIVDVLEE